MKRYFKHLDDLVIRYLECFTHWTQKVFGIRSVTWERLCWVVVIVLARKDYFVMSFGTLRFLLTFYCERHCTRVGNSDAPTANPHRYLSQTARPFCLVLLIAVSPAWIYTVDFMMPIWVLGMYFNALDDLPPSVSRLKQMLTEITASTQTKELVDQ